jgi:hypothetical protein
VNLEHLIWAWLPGAQRLTQVRSASQVRSAPFKILHWEKQVRSANSMRSASSLVRSASQNFSKNTAISPFAQ